MGENSAKAFHPFAPHDLEPVEEVVRTLDGVDVAAHELLPSAPLFGHELGSLEHRHVFLDRKSVV